MAHRILKCTGPAARAGVKEGDLLVRVNGELVVDALDYSSLTACRAPVFTVRRDGKEMTLRLRKGEDEDAGCEFSSSLMDGMRMCCNRCLFCFVEQLPDGVRDSLRVKDDDWRMSLMMGNYVTLTNMPDSGLDRIIRRHASPLYVSVHAWNAELRARVMGTPRAARIAEQLRRLAAGGIDFHCQCVLCPGINDGDALEETIENLSRLMPNALSLALVPVGLTCHREGLCPIRPYTREEARAVLDIADRWREKLLRETGTRFVFPSDEFYIIAGRELPGDGEYEDYGQIDDGVGMLRLLETEFTDCLENDMPVSTGEMKELVIACGVSAAPYLEKLTRGRIPGKNVRVVPVENRFFGSTVTVSGLLTGSDLYRALKDESADAFLITCTMLRDGEDRFLDDMTLEELTQKLARPVIPVGRSGDELLRALCAPETYRR